MVVLPVYVLDCLHSALVGDAAETKQYAYALICDVINENSNVKFPFHSKNKIQQQ